VHRATHSLLSNALLQETLISSAAETTDDIQTVSEFIAHTYVTTFYWPSRQNDDDELRF
jgi:hypothetical protein